ncbi:MAG: hypothetical protein HRT73_02980 [Flavobacteriales bacterium]|nr:hypothetical protein [Flavobacteriales bacterium]
MGHKNVCVNCKKSFNLGMGTENLREGNCPECGNKMKLVSHRFRPPKKTDIKKWKVVEYLFQNGFYFDHIQDPEHQSWVPYPENMNEAKDFVKKYKDLVN